MDLKTCQWLVPKPDSDDETMLCGKPASAEVTVKSKITHAKVWLCPGHKREHNVSFAAARTTRKAAPGASRCTGLASCMSSEHIKGCACYPPAYLSKS
jgi:hypothetical protein